MRPALVIIFALLLAPAVRADPELAQARLCLGCHALDRKVVGPSFREIAKRHAGQAGAAEMLAGKIRNGGAGAWGAVPMPANPRVTPDEARQLAAWVLATK